MREFIRETAIPVLGYFLGVFLCIGIVIFGAAVAIDLVSDPTEIFFAGDVQ